MNMRILVCVKQVPDTLDVRFDPASGFLKREDMPAAMNPYDQCALEAAVRLKDRDPSIHMTVLTMGPAGCERVLREALAVAADEAYMISDQRLHGIDTVGTAKVLSAAIRKIEAEAGEPFDAIFCGLKSSDGAGSCIGPMLAALFKLPCQTNVMTLQKEALQMPCVLTFGKADYSMRYPKILRIIEAQQQEITRFDMEDLKTDAPAIRGQGGPALLSMKYRPLNKKRRIIKGKTAEEAAAVITGILKRQHII